MSRYIENSVPSDLVGWRVSEVARLRRQFRTAAYEDAGVLRWNSNNRCVPLDCFKDAFCTPPSAQEVEIDRETTAFLAEYRAARADHKPDAEEMFEMRAAFGPGETVVDIITGQKFRT